MAAACKKAIMLIYLNADRLSTVVQHHSFPRTRLLPLLKNKERIEFKADAVLVRKCFTKDSSLMGSLAIWSRLRSSSSSQLFVRPTRRITVTLGLGVLVPGPSWSMDHASGTLFHITHVTCTCGYSLSIFTSRLIKTHLFFSSFSVIYVAKSWSMSSFYTVIERNFCRVP